MWSVVGKTIESPSEILEALLHIIILKNSAELLSTKYLFHIIILKNSEELLSIKLHQNDTNLRSTKSFAVNLALEMCSFYIETDISI